MAQKRSPLSDLGYEVFLDLKLHDIPTTVAKAARVAGTFGVRYLTMHTAGGTEMLGAGVEGFHAGAASAGLPMPIALGVTVLTSTSGVTASLLNERVGIAIDSACDGLVCAGTDLPIVRAQTPDQFLVVPGTRMPDGDTHDQARSTTPAALKAGANLLIIGRMITHALDLIEATHALIAHLNADTKVRHEAIVPPRGVGS